MCMPSPKMPEPAKPAAPPPPVEKNAESLAIGDEATRKMGNARSGLNKLKIDRVL